MMMKKHLLSLLVALGISVAAHAQAPVAARQRELSVTAGAMASGFNSNYTDPDYVGSNYLFGPGAYVDVHFTHWVQLEAEGRWMRWSSFGDSETQDNYLIGPRVPIKRFGKYQTYGKVLIGLAKMKFPADDPLYSSGSFTDLAFGGTLERSWGRRLSVRMIDFEFQDWPKFVPNESIHPFGISVGVGYKIF